MPTKPISSSELAFTFQLFPTETTLLHLTCQNCGARLHTLETPDRITADLTTCLNCLLRLREGGPIALT